METSRDLTALSIPLVGELVARDDPWEPYRLIDPSGETVEGARAFLRDLQGAGRSAATARSYGMDMLRWFRFLWAVEVPWDRGHVPWSGVADHSAVVLVVLGSAGALSGRSAG
ncbi:hypothetical protein ACFYNN_29200, partial [Streptomyces sp. NPDC006978]|uniref:hypothetical protein n=1 Tax=Streptomyces sp. NPDC006978 TaxID=3364769 RepID=UPI00367B55CE